MKKIVVLSEDDSLRRELSTILPEGFKLSTQVDGRGLSVIFFDIDTMRTGLIRELADRNLVIAVTKEKRTDSVMETSTFGAYETIQRPLKIDRMSMLLKELTDFSEELKQFHTVTSPPPSSATCIIVGQ